MTNALLITDFAKNQQNSTWAAREFNPATDMAASQNFAIEVLQGVFDELDAEMREINNVWLLERQAANYPVRETRKHALGKNTRMGKIITNKDGIQSYLKDGKVVTIAGYKSKKFDANQTALPLEYLETPEPAELDVDYMRKKWLEADTPAKKTYWLNIGNFAVMLNTLKTQQEVAAVELPTDPFLNLRYAELKAQRLEQVPGEHQLICQPDFTHNEGIFAVTEHLGECVQPKPFLVNGVRHMNGTGLTTLEKQIFHEAQFTGQGEAVVAHECHEKREWYKDASQIKKIFSLSTEKAETLKMAFNILDTTPKMAVEFKKWLTAKPEQGFRYFENLASEMVKVTDMGEPELIDVSDEIYNQINNPVVKAEDDVTVLTGDCITLTNEFTTIFDRKTNTAYTVKGKHGKKEFTVTTVEGKPVTELEDIETVAYHKLDDPRDFVLTWEERQPAAFQEVLADIRKADLAGLKKIGTSLFNDKRFTYTQNQVIWDEFHRAKARRTPRLRKIALIALERLADKSVDLKKVANWLHGDGKKRLDAHELSVVWDAWKKCRKAYAPKQTVMNIPEIPLECYAE